MSLPEAGEEIIGGTHASVPKLLAQLREATRDQHDRIEAIPGLNVLLSPALTAGQYIAALRALHAFQAGLHRRLPPLLAGVTGLSFPDAGVLQALADDLTWFGAALPRPAAGPRLVRDMPSALGALYLLEGSQLGGRVIGKSVARSLAVSPGRGGTFFCGRTADNARLRWAEFCAVLADQSDKLDAAGAARVLAGARASFAYLEAMLCGKPGAAQAAAAPQIAVAAGNDARAVN